MTMGFRTYLLYLFMVFVRPIEQFMPEAMELRPMLMLWVVTFITSVIDSRRLGGGAAKATHYWMLLGMALTVGLSLAANGYASYITSAIGDFSTPAMLFVLTALNITSIERLKTTCKLLLICLLLLSMESIYSYYTGFRVEDLVISQLANEHIEPPKYLPPIPAEDTSGTIIWRIRSVGFLRDPNDFAQTIVMVLPFMFMLLPAGTSWLGTLWRLAPSAGILMWALSLTHSRGGLLGAALMAIVALKNRLGNFKTGLILALALAAFQFYNSGGGRELSSKEQSANERIEAWAEGLQMLKGNPWFGVGYGNFTDHHIRTAHNSYVLCFSELGLIGYFFWIGLIVMAMKSVNQVIHLASPGSEIQRMANLLRTSMIGFLVCAWFLSRTYIPTLFISMSMGVCLLHCAQKESLKSPASEGLSQPVKWLKATLVTMFASIATVSMFIRLST